MLMGWKDNTMPDLVMRKQTHKADWPETRAIFVKSQESLCEWLPRSSSPTFCAVPLLQQLLASGASFAT